MLKRKYTFQKKAIEAAENGLLKTIKWPDVGAYICSSTQELKTLHKASLGYTVVSKTA